MRKNYRWGILGAGRIAAKFCTALNSVEGSVVHAVASRDRNKAKEFAAKHNAARYYDNYEDLVNDDEVDIIYIATPHPFHYQQTLQCLKNKKAVLCEKPLALSFRHTSEMIAAAAEANVFFMEGLWTACMPFMDKIKSIINDDVIGEPKYVSADFGFAAEKDMESRLYKKALGGGAVLDIGVYTLSLATIILGEPTRIKAISRLAETGIDEYSNVVLQYKNGETAHCISSIVFNTPIEAEIIGAKGRIKIASPWFKATDISLHVNDRPVENFHMPHPCNGFEHEIEEVMRCLDHGLLQSEKAPHHLSLTVSKIMDEVLSQAGVSYAVES